MVERNAEDNGQPESRAFTGPLRRKKRLKHVRQGRKIDASPTVTDIHAHDPRDRR